MAVVDPNGYARELHIWGLIGAATWFSPLFLLACSCWALALPPSMACGFALSSAVCGSFACFASYLLFWVMQLGMLLVHHAVQSPHEAPPVQLPRLGLRGRSWPCVFLARAVLRSRKLKDVAAVGVLLCSAVISSALFVYSYPRMRADQSLSPPNFTFSCVFGLALGGIHVLQHLVRCRDVLAFPFIHRHRYFRIRHCLPEVLLSSLRVSGLALLLAFALKPSTACQTITGSAAQPHSVVWFGVVLSRHLSALLAAFHAGSLWVFGWLAGHAVLSIVLTEPPRLVQQHEGQQGAAQTLLKALGSSSPTLQDLALAEFAEIAEGTTAAHAARRADVFADETGRLGWTPLAGFLVEELRDFAGGLGSALSAMPGEGMTAKPSAGRSPRVQWNVLSASNGLGGAKGGKEQDKAAWSVRAHYYRVLSCLRAVAGLAAASRTEDRYGVVLLCEPLLADVLACLLATVLALQQYTKQESGSSSRGQQSLPRRVQNVLSLLGPPSHPTLQQPEFCAHALEDAARTAAYRVVRTFGPSLQPLLKECRLPPALPQATPSELSRLLQGMLAHQE